MYGYISQFHARIQSEYCLPASGQCVCVYFEVRTTSVIVIIMLGAMLKSIHLYSCMLMVSACIHVHVYAGKKQLAAFLFAYAVYPCTSFVPGVIIVCRVDVLCALFLVES